MEGGSGNLKDVSRRISALTNTVNSVMKVKDENKATVKEAALIAGVATQERIANATEEQTKIQKGTLQIAKEKMRKMLPFNKSKNQIKFDKTIPDVEVQTIPLSLVERLNRLKGVGGEKGVEKELEEIERKPVAEPILVNV